MQNNETGEAATGVNINGIANVQIRIPAASVSYTHLLQLCKSDSDNGEDGQR